MARKFNWAKDEARRRIQHQGSEALDLEDCASELRRHIRNDVRFDDYETEDEPRLVHPLYDRRPESSGCRNLTSRQSWDRLPSPLPELMKKLGGAEMQLRQKQAEVKRLDQHIRQQRIKMTGLRISPELLSARTADLRRQQGEVEQLREHIRQRFTHAGLRIPPELKR
jgi:hypothetical protein